VLEEEKRTLTNKTNESKGKEKHRAQLKQHGSSETEKALNCAAAKDKKEKKRQRKGDDFTWSKHRRKEKHHSS